MIVTTRDKWECDHEIGRAESPHTWRCWGCGALVATIWRGGGRIQVGIVLEEP